MGGDYYRSTIVRVGAEADEMLEGGALILFAEPVPEALAEVSVVHQPDQAPTVAMRPGDRLRVGDELVEVTAVGERADEGLRSLGHVVVYLNPPQGTGLLPGAVHGTGTLTVPGPGASLLLTRP